MNSEGAVPRMGKQGREIHQDTTAVRAGAEGRGQRVALLLVMLLAGFLPSRLWATVQGDAGVELTWTDNLTLTASSRADIITMPFASLETGVGEHFALGYRLNGYVYGTESELNALWQSATAGYQLTFGDDHDLKTEIGYDGTLHPGGATDLDHHQLAGRLYLTFRPTPKTFLTPGIEASWRTYPSSQGLDHFEAVGSVLANRSFPSRTTLRLSGTLFFRQFLQTEDPAGIPAQTAAATGTSLLSDLLLSAYDDGPGPGGQAGAGPGSGPGRTGGNRWNPGGRGQQQGPPPGTAVEENLASRSAGQFLVAARVAQSLGARAGIFLEGTYRVNFLDPARYAEGSIPGADLAFFDDHYGYEGPGGLLQFTLLLPLRMRVILSGRVEDRRYPGREALDLDGNPVRPSGLERHDQRYEVGFRWEFSRGFDRAFPSAVQAAAGFAHLWNPSNDAWYDTEENRAFASVSLGW